jgi:hypothetical protein
VRDEDIVDPAGEEPDMLVFYRLLDPAGNIVSPIEHATTVSCLSAEWRVIMVYYS